MDLSLPLLKSLRNSKISRVAEGKKSYACMRNVVATRTAKCLWELGDQINTCCLLPWLRLGFVSGVQPGEAVLFSFYLCNPWKRVCLPACLPAHSRWSPCFARSLSSRSVARRCSRSLRMTSLWMANSCQNKT